jgi:hypothetical protein
MNTIIRTAILIVLMALTTPVAAEGFYDDVQLKARVGYSIGGTAPLGMPATIRSIEAFHLTPNFLLGIDGSKLLYDRWGFQAGLRVENKGMDGEVLTKAYRMKVRMDESEMEGYYTGRVRQKVTEWMLTLPVQATYQLGQKVRVKAGPYVSLLIDKDFSGYAADGYLRKDDPTGLKVVMGNKEGEWATYDFTDDMRWLQAGIAAGAEWQAWQRLGFSFDLSWGLTGIHKSDFKTVEQTLYPIYGTIAVTYKLR